MGRQSGTCDWGQCRNRSSYCQRYRVTRKVPKKTVMFNWSPCNVLSYRRYVWIHWSVRKINLKWLLKFIYWAEYGGKKFIKSPRNIPKSSLLNEQKIRYLDSQYFEWKNLLKRFFFFMECQTKSNFTSVNYRE